MTGWIVDNLVKVFEAEAQQGCLHVWSKKYDAKKENLPSCCCVFHYPLAISLTGQPSVQFYTLKLVLRKAGMWLWEGSLYAQNLFVAWFLRIHPRWCYCRVVKTRTPGMTCFYRNRPHLTIFTVKCNSNFGFRSLALVIATREHYFLLLTSPNPYHLEIFTGWFYCNDI